MKSNEPQNGERAGKRPPQVLRRIIISLLILLAGVALFRYLIATKPRIDRRPMDKQPPLVRVMPLETGTYTTKITAMGSVIPAREIVLKSPVGGEILSVNENFTPGGLLKQGKQALQIDPRDYELALEQKQRALSDAEYAYKLEQGRQDVARREWELLYGKTGPEDAESTLALRKPHLAKVKVDLRASEAELEQARLNLARTGIDVPFNALVLNRYVDRGSYVAPQEKLADLVGTDEYWVQVSVPLDRLDRLQVPENGDRQGSAARIFYQGNRIREGRVLRLLGDLSKQGRMARLLIAVKDPLGLSGDKPPLLIGEYVRVVIEGEELRQVYAVPREYLHNDREIWSSIGKAGLMCGRPMLSGGMRKTSCCGTGWLTAKCW